MGRYLQHTEEVNGKCITQKMSWFQKTVSSSLLFLMQTTNSGGGSTQILYLR